MNVLKRRRMYSKNPLFRTIPSNHHPWLRPPSCFYLGTCARNQLCNQSNFLRNHSLLPPWISLNPRVPWKYYGFGLKFCYSFLLNLKVCIHLRWNCRQMYQQTLYLQGLSSEWLGPTFKLGAWKHGELELIAQRRGGRVPPRTLSFATFFRRIRVLCVLV